VRRRDWRNVTLEGRDARAHSLFQPEIRRFTLKNQNGVAPDLIGFLLAKSSTASRINAGMRVA
jgi:hypothetical protein